MDVFHEQTEAEQAHTDDVKHGNGTLFRDVNGNALRKGERVHFMDDEGTMRAGVVGTRLDQTSAFDAIHNGGRDEVVPIFIGDDRSEIDLVAISDLIVRGEPPDTTEAGRSGGVINARQAHETARRRCEQHATRDHEGNDRIGRSLAWGVVMIGVVVAVAAATMWWAAYGTQN